MDGQRITGFIGFSILLLLVAFSFPVAIDATQTQATDTYVLESGDTVTVTKGLNLTANTITTTDANITLEGTESGDSDTKVVNETETKSFTTDGETTNVTVESIETIGSPKTEQANLTVEHTRTYNWSPGAKTFVAQLDVILALMGFLVAIGGIWVILP